MPCLRKRVLDESDHRAALSIGRSIWREDFERRYEHDELRIPFSSKLAVRVQFESKRKTGFAFTLPGVPWARRDRAGLKERRYEVRSAKKRI
jgi:hypothetical protein